MGTLLTVVGGCSRGGAAAFSFSQRSWAAVSVTVAMASPGRGSKGPSYAGFTGMAVEQLAVGAASQTGE